MNGGLNETPRSDRLHIGIFGRRNSGKSSLINALTGQETALVSEVAGTTTDPVTKAMELHGIGPVVFIDTAGFDDEGDLGKLRVEKTEDAVERTEVALVVFAGEEMEAELAWVQKLKERRIPVIPVLNKTDVLADPERLKTEITEFCGIEPVLACAREGKGVDQIRGALIRSLPEDYGSRSITAGIAEEGDTVMLVMPQDIQAPKGRLILPQVQTIRELLDRRCQVVCATADCMEKALAALSKPPAAIITDSQVFKTVCGKKPPESRLTSFSILFAAYKGDLEYYVESAPAISRLDGNSRVLIAEACTHAPLSEDIGREKIPRLLRRTAGEELKVDFAAGQDFPKDLSGYQLVIHCGGCMFNRKYLLSRIEAAKRQGVPMTNYGVALAYMNGILEEVSL